MLRSSTPLLVVQRRAALQQLAVAVGGFASLPAWASGWNAATVPSHSRFLSTRQNDLLATVVDTFIPATDTPGVNSPGAKDLGVHTFLQKVVTDCYEPKAQTTLAQGLDAADALARQTYSRPFGDCDTAQRLDVLNRMKQSTDSAQTDFYKLVKGLTVRGYLNSEYVMTNLTKFEYAPGRYHGCVPVPAKPISQSK